MITNPSGITCEDVFIGIYENFQEHVKRREFNSWPVARQERCNRTYNVRMQERRQMCAEESSETVGLRRIDCMGDRVMFRGLQPSPIHEGAWIIFLGPS
jgi:hypothetical protein